MYIRKDQLTAMANAAFREATPAREQLLAALTRRIRADYPVETGEFDDDALRERVFAAVRRGAEAGLSREAAFYVYAALSVVVGPHFDEHPRIRPLLQDPQYTPDERLTRLPSAMPPDLWQSLIAHARRIPRSDP